MSFSSSARVGHREGFGLRRRGSGLELLANSRGGINFLVLFFVAFVAVAAYFGYAYMPHWMRNRDVILAMREAGYQAWRENDDVLLGIILKRTDGIVLVEDEEEGPYPAIDETMIEIKRDSKNVYIEVSYEVEMRLPWSSKSKELRFENHTMTDLEVPTR